MKKLAMLTALVTLIGSLGVTAPVSAEETISVGTELGAGWQITKMDNTDLATGVARTYITDEESHSGNNSLYIKGGSGEVFHIGHDAAPTNFWSNVWDGEGKSPEFEVSFWVKSNDNGFMSGTNDDGNLRYNVQIGPFDYNDNTNGNASLRKMKWEIPDSSFSEPDENGWRKVTFGYIYPYGYNANAPQKHWFNIRVLGLTYGMYIDDITVKYIGSDAAKRAQNIHLLNDGGFEPLTDTGEDIADYDLNIAHSHASYTNPPTAKIVADETGNKMLKISFPEYINPGYSEVLKITKKLSLPYTNIGWGEAMISFKMKGQYRRESVSIQNDKYIVHEAKLNGADNTNDSGKYSHEKATVTVLDDGWIQYDCRVGGEFANSTFTFRFMQYGFGEVLIDDICVRKLTVDSTTKEILSIGTQDQVYNGTFDSETEKKISPKNWNLDMNKTTGKDFIGRSTKYAYSGNNSVYISAPNTWVDQRWVQLRQVIDGGLDSTKEYTVKAKFRTLSPETAFFAYFTDASVNGEMSEDKAYLLSSITTQNDGRAANITDLGNDWYEYTSTLKAKEGATSLGFLTMGGVDGVWVDDVSLTDENGTEYIVNGSFEEFDKYEVGGAYIVLDELEPVPAPKVGENTLYVPITTNEAGIDYYVYFAIYKGGQLFKVQKAEYLDAAVGTKEVDATITIEEDANYSGKYTAKAFVWDNSMKAFCNAIDFIEAE